MVVREKEGDDLSWTRCLSRVTAPCGAAEHNFNMPAALASSGRPSQALGEPTSYRSNRSPRTYHVRHQLTM